MLQTSKAAVAICAVTIMGLVSSGCRHKAPTIVPLPTPPPAAVVQPPPPPPPPPPVRPPAPPVPLTEEQVFAGKSIADLNAEAPLGDALFDYDQSVIGTEAATVLGQDAKWLLRWPSTKVRVEGHCDERGTAEYNLALGERRAAAVRAYLMSLGVASDRMVVVSYGKERPACAESSEQCWRRNRRGHLTITAK